MFAARVAGSSRSAPPVLEEVGAARAPRLHGRSRTRAGGKRRNIKSEAVGVAARCNEEEGNTNGKLFPFILQVVLAKASTEEENAPEEPSCRLRAASLPVCLVCCRWTNVRFPTQRLKLPHCNRRRSSSEVEEEER